MVKVGIYEGKVSFKLERAQKFLAMKSEVKIPLENISGISTENVKPVWLARRMGTHLPGVFMGGTFWTREGKTFYYVRRRSKCITLRLRNHEYSKVVFEVDDKEGVADYIRRAL